jgi:hypothetical protein
MIFLYSTKHAEPPSLLPNARAGYDMDDLGPVCEQWVIKNHGLPDKWDGSGHKSRSKWTANLSNWYLDVTGHLIQQFGPVHSRVLHHFWSFEYLLLWVNVTKNIGIKSSIEKKITWRMATYILTS